MKIHLEQVDENGLYPEAVPMRLGHVPRVHDWLRMSDRDYVVERVIWLWDGPLDVDAIVRVRRFESAPDPPPERMTLVEMQRRGMI